MFYASNGRGTAELTAVPHKIDLSIFLMSELKTLLLLYNAYAAIHALYGFPEPQGTHHKDALYPGFHGSCE